MDVRKRVVDANIPPLDANSSAIDANIPTLDANNRVLEANNRVLDANTPAVDANSPAIDANPSAIDANALSVGANTLAIDAIIWAVDGSNPTIDAIIPEIDASNPTIEAMHRVLDASMPAVDANLPALDARRPGIDAVVSGNTVQQRGTHGANAAVDAINPVSAGFPTDAHAAIGGIDLAVGSPHARADAFGVRHSVNGRRGPSPRLCAPAGQVSARTPSQVRGTLAAMTLAEQMLARAEELERAAQRLRETAAVLQQADVVAAEPLVGAHASLPVTPPSPPAPEVWALSARPRNGVEAVAKILAESRGTPLSRKEILARLAANGFRLSDATLLSYLSRYTNFKRVRRDQFILGSKIDPEVAARRRQLMAEAVEAEKAELEQRKRLGGDSTV